jgi:hypothetical protein
MTTLQKDLVSLWRFLEGADERPPLLAETENNISVHIAVMELNLNGLAPSGFSGQDGGIVKLNAVSRVDAVFSYG